MKRWTAFHFLSEYQKYAGYVVSKRNQIRATITFNRRKQEPAERFDNFVTSLKVLVKECAYDGTEDSIVRDAIVLRSHHSAVREKCLDKCDFSSVLAKRFAPDLRHFFCEHCLKLPASRDTC